jgi:hypothetical protein
VPSRLVRLDLVRKVVAEAAQVAAVVTAVAVAGVATKELAQALMIAPRPVCISLMTMSSRQTTPPSHIQRHWHFNGVSFTREPSWPRPTFVRRVLMDKESLTQEPSDATE